MNRQERNRRFGIDIDEAYEAALSPKQWPQGSCVYFLTCAGTGAIKIGVTENLKDRVTQLHTIVPYGISDVWHFSGGREDERRLHKELAEYRLSGEWFTPAVAVTEARRHARCRQVHPYKVRRYRTAAATRSLPSGLKPREALPHPCARLCGGGV